MHICLTWQEWGENGRSFDNCPEFEYMRYYLPQSSKSNNLTSQLKDTEFFAQQLMNYCHGAKSDNLLYEFSIDRNCNLQLKALGTFVQQAIQSYINRNSVGLENTGDFKIVRYRYYSKKLYGTSQDYSILKSKHK